jgi:hypothetical protein
MTAAMIAGIIIILDILDDILIVAFAGYAGRRLYGRSRFVPKPQVHSRLNRRVRRALK